MSKLHRFARNNGLSLAVFGLFLTFLCAESITGLFAYNNDRQDHGQPAVGFAQFLTSGRFIESTAENWESEFLEMSFYAILTSFLYQRGSAESKPLGRPAESDRDPRRTQPQADTPWPVRRGGWVL